jgi:hypothetical protein
VPYVRCSHCGLNEFSAAIYSGRDACSRCGGLLPIDESRSRRLELLSATARDLRAIRGGKADTGAALERRFERLAGSLAVRDPVPK